VAITYGEGQTVEVGPGESFGEMALIDGHLRSADVVASTDVELYPVDRSLFRILVHDTPFSLSR
jgi:CRP-like cAMP-binding protein